MTTTQPDTAAFDDYRKSLNVEALRQGFYQASLSQPLFITLEWLTMPEIFWKIQWLRIGFLLPPWISWCLLRKNKSFVHRHIDWFMPWSIYPAIVYAVYVAMLHEGYTSPHIYGVIMIMAAVNFLTFMPTKMNIAFSASVLAAYVAPLFVGLQPTNLPSFIGSSTILMGSMVFALSAQRSRLKTTMQGFLDGLANARASAGMYGSLPTQIGRFELRGRLGIGGMAETFLGRAVGPGGFEQRVCIKCVLPGYAQEEAFRELFMEEARITASFQHNNIVKVIDFGEDPTAQRLYLALELIEGTDLRGLMRTYKDSRVDPEVLTVVATDIAQALVYAHNHQLAGTDGRSRHGVVHRDISPSNVLLSRSGEVKLTDFGIAKELRPEESKMSTALKGKLVYMSPEQLRGDKLDGRSDLFSLGVMLFECLAGERPFDAQSDLGTMRAILRGQRKPCDEAFAADVPSVLREAINSLLEPDLTKRCPSADDFLKQIESLYPKPSARQALARQVTSIEPIKKDSLNT